MKTFFKSTRRTSRQYMRRGSSSTKEVQAIPTGSPDSITIEKYFRHYASNSVVDLVEPDLAPSSSSSSSPPFSYSSKRAKLKRNSHRRSISLSLGKIRELGDRPREQKDEPARGTRIDQDGILAVDKLDEKLWSRVFAHVDTNTLKQLQLTSRLFYKAATAHTWANLWIEVKATAGHHGVKVPQQYRKLWGGGHHHDGECKCTRGLLHQCRCPNQRVIMINNTNVRHVLKHVSRKRGYNWFTNVRNVVAWTDDSTATTEWNVLPPSMTVEALKWLIDTVIPEQCHNLQRMELASGVYTNNAKQLLKIQPKLTHAHGSTEKYLPSNSWRLFQNERVAIDVQLGLTHKTLLYQPLFTPKADIRNVSLQVLDASTLDMITLPPSVQYCKMYLACVVPSHMLVVTTAASLGQKTPVAEQPGSAHERQPVVTSAQLLEVFREAWGLTSLEVNWSSHTPYTQDFTWLPKSIRRLTVTGEGCGGQAALHALVSLPELHTLHVSGTRMGYLLACLACPRLHQLTAYNLSQFPTDVLQQHQMRCSELTLTCCSRQATRGLLCIMEPGQLAKLSWRVRESWSERELSDLLSDTQHTLSSVRTLYLHFVQHFPSINKPLILDEIALSCINLSTCCIWDHDDAQCFVLSGQRDWSTHHIALYV